MQPARSHLDHIDASQPRPVIVGTDIKVSQIAMEFELQGMSPDEIIEAHPHLTLAQVHAAIAWYYDHLEAIQQDWRDSRELIERLRAEYPSRIASRR
jgi:uncharacterized protein (DUF433 family)